MEKITVSLKAFLDEELNKFMVEYEKKRLEVAQSAADGFNISAALEEERLWEAKIKSMKNLVKGKKVIRSNKKSEQVSLGSRVDIIHNEEEKSFIVDGVGYKNDLLTVVSYTSPIGSVLMGKQVGDIISLDGATIKINKVVCAW